MESAARRNRVAMVTVELVLVRREDCMALDKIDVLVLEREF
jgi:tRNA (Thr-GGU) A37 N-methylase